MFEVIGISLPKPEKILQMMIIYKLLYTILEDQITELKMSISLFISNE